MAAFFLKTYSYWLWLVFILLQLSVADLTLVNMGTRAFILLAILLRFQEIPQTPSPKGKSRSSASPSPNGSKTGPRRRTKIMMDYQTCAIIILNIECIGLLVLYFCYSLSHRTCYLHLLNVLVPLLTYIFCLQSAKIILTGLIFDYLHYLQRAKLNYLF